MSSRDRYDRRAPGYANRLDPTLAGPVERMVELAGARPDVRLLDLATGTGTIARAAAARGASVVGVDASPGMLEVARGLSPGLDLRRADACALPFGGGAFDVVACGLALSHFAEREQALGEVLRVLRHGGTLVASAWAESSSIPTRKAAEILDRYAAPAESSVDEETWADPQRGSDILREAGFADVSAQTETFRGEFSDPDDALAWFTAWPLTAARLARLDPRRRERFFTDASDALAATNLSWSFAFNLYVAHRPDD